MASEQLHQKIVSNKCLETTFEKLFIIILEYILPDSHTASGMVYLPYFPE